MWLRIKHRVDFSLNILHKFPLILHNKRVLQWWIPKWCKTLKHYSFTSKDRRCWSGSFKSSWVYNSSRLSSFPISHRSLNSTNSLNKSLIILFNKTTITTKATINGSTSKMNIIMREWNKLIKTSIQRTTISIHKDITHREKHFTRSQERNKREKICISRMSPYRISPKSRKPPQSCNKLRIIWTLNKK